MQLSTAETIVDEKKFLEAHRAITEANKGKAFIKPYLLRLKKYFELKQAI